MSSDPSQRSASKFLSLVLRHDPALIGVALDDAGWVDVDVLLDALARHGKALERSALERLVRESDKQRFALSADGRRIRANQGHSVDVALGYAASPPPELLYHGTVERFLSAIRVEGLVRGARHHVHLSATRDVATSVGSRRGRPVVIEVDAGAMARQGYEFFRSENGVWLTDHVPARFLRLDAATR
jgi:putative RNA 2'-phosphotransferase